MICFHRPAQAVIPTCQHNANPDTCPRCQAHGAYLLLGYDGTQQRYQGAAMLGSHAAAAMFATALAVISTDRGQHAQAAMWRQTARGHLEVNR